MTVFIAYIYPAETADDQDLREIARGSLEHCRRATRLRLGVPALADWMRWDGCEFEVEAWTTDPGNVACGGVVIMPAALALADAQGTEAALAEARVVAVISIGGRAFPLRSPSV